MKYTHYSFHFDSTNNQPKFDLLRGNLIFNSSSLQEKYDNLRKLIRYLEGRKFPNITINLVNENISFLNQLDHTNEKAFNQHLSKAMEEIKKHLRKEHQLYPMNYFTIHGFSIGVIVIGFVFSIICNAIFHTMSVNITGYFFGVFFSAFVGAGVDNYTSNQNRQLPVKD